VKDVFVYVPSTDIANLGINSTGFADFTALGVTIHAPDTTLGGVIDWVVNALHGTGPEHLMDQRAIVLMDAGASHQHSLMGSTSGFLPNRTDCSVYTQSIRFIHHADVVNWDATCREQRRRVIGHECGHGVNLYTDDNVNFRHTIANNFPAGCVMNLDGLWNAIPHAYCANSPDGGCQNLWRLRPPPP
jgi:hypothetical protein